MFDRAGHLPAPLLSNCQVFLDACRPVQFTLREQVLDVEADVLLRRLKELNHLVLREPGLLVLHADSSRVAPSLT